MSRIIFFTIFFSLIFGFHLLVFSVFRNFIKERFKNSKIFKFTVLPFILFNLPYLYLFIGRIELEYVENPFLYIYLMLFYIFQGGVIITGLYLLIIKLIKYLFLGFYKIAYKIKYLKSKFEKIEDKEKMKKLNNSRRAFLHTATAFVSGYAFIGSAAGVIKRSEYEITNQEIRVKNLPSELKNLSIVLISDIHAGPFLGESEMREYSEIINDLNPDLILIPGDFTNSQVKEAYDFCKGFKDLKAKHGIYGTLGNHDYFSNPNEIAKIISNDSPIKMMRNSSELLNINGQNLSLVGIEDTRDSGGSYNSVIVKYINDTETNTINLLKEKKLDYNSIPKILLYHKPYVFDDILDKKFDLIVSGHTHGGQVVLANIGNFNLSLAGIANNKYISGLYSRGNSQMYVSRGIGYVGLPMRLNCKPEITKLKLV